MQNNKSWKIGGISYEFIDAEKIAKIYGDLLIQNLKTGKTRMLFTHEPIPDGWEEIAYDKKALKQEANVLDQIGKLMEEHGRGESLDPSRPYAGVNPIDIDYFINHHDGSLKNNFCLVARRDEEVIGILSFNVENIRGDRIGEVDRGVVSPEGRKKSDKEQSPSLEERAVSENLMILAITILLGRFRCDNITAKPISKEGKGYAERHGFVSQGEYYFLDEEIFKEAQIFFEDQGLSPGDALAWKGINDLRKEIEPVINLLQEEYCEKKESAGKSPNRGK